MRLLRLGCVTMRGARLSAVVLFPTPAEEEALRDLAARTRFVGEHVHRPGDGTAVAFFEMASGQVDAVFAAEDDAPTHGWPYEARDAAIAEVARMFLVEDNDLQ